jgi:hypothetical protein
MGTDVRKTAWPRAAGAVLLWALAGAADSPPGEGPGVLRVALSAQASSIRFGDELTVVATLSNRGPDSITIAPGALRLMPHGWSAAGGGGTGLGPDIRVPTGDAALVVPPAGEARLTFADRENTVVALGPMSTMWRVATDKDEMRPLLGDQGDLRVAYEVRPSSLMESAWAARTDADRAALLPAVRDLLLHRRPATDWRQRRLIEGTFERLAASGLPLLDALAKDPEPVVRVQVIEQYPFSAWAVGNMAALKAAEARYPAFAWTQAVPAGDEKAAKEACIRTALAGLSDGAAMVRVSAVKVLTWQKHGPAEEVKWLAGDGDPAVRGAVQEYLALFGGRNWGAEAIVAALADADKGVRQAALKALETSADPPPQAALAKAFAAAKAGEAERLVALLFEQEDGDLPAVLRPRFHQRDEWEKLAILTAVAGHADGATLQIARLGLADKSLDVQRQAILRLLPFAAEKAQPLLEEYRGACPAALRPFAEAALNEIRQRTAFPFLAEATGDVAAGIEKAFPSRNGTVPMVSPDGKWVAYVQTGWGRPGGSGGMGRSNLLSLVHVVRSNGQGDRIVSDMFLVGWMSDGRRVGSARDGFAAITDLDGQIVAEFGEVLNAPILLGRADADWRQEFADPMFATRMPHRRGLGSAAGEDAAFSPDGKWLGPGGPGRATFLGVDGQSLTVPDVPEWHGQATWSPDGRHVLVWSFRAARVLDPQAGKAIEIPDVDPLPAPGSWEYRKCRWNQWARDGSRLAFVRRGEVWTCRPDGQHATRLTFSMPREWHMSVHSALDDRMSAWVKAFPTFSRGRRYVAYLRYQADRREHYSRLGPTDLWVIDLETGLETRVTRPAEGRIYCLDWLDDLTLIFDRVGEKMFYSSPGLRTISLAKTPASTVGR